ncbi:MAG: hypothetical protein AB8B67_01805 [Rickettsiaceae bacterium]
MKKVSTQGQEEKLLLARANIQDRNDYNNQGANTGLNHTSNVVDRVNISSNNSVNNTYLSLYKNTVTSLSIPLNTDVMQIPSTLPRTHQNYWPLVSDQLLKEIQDIFRSPNSSPESKNACILAILDSINGDQSEYTLDKIFAKIENAVAHQFNDYDRDFALNTIDHILADEKYFVALLVLSSYQDPTAVADLIKSSKGRALGILDKFIASGHLLDEKTIQSLDYAMKNDLEENLHFIVCVFMNVSQKGLSLPKLVLMNIAHYCIYKSDDPSVIAKAAMTLFLNMTSELFLNMTSEDSKGLNSARESLSLMLLRPIQFDIDTKPIPAELAINILLEDAQNSDVEFSSMTIQYLLSAIKNCIAQSEQGRLGSKDFEERRFIDVACLVLLYAKMDQELVSYMIGQLNEILGETINVPYDVHQLIEKVILSRAELLHLSLFESLKKDLGNMLSIVERSQLTERAFNSILTTLNSMRNLPEDQQDTIIALAILICAQNNQCHNHHPPRELICKIFDICQNTTNSSVIRNLTLFIHIIYNAGYQLSSKEIEIIPALYKSIDECCSSLEQNEQSDLKEILAELMNQTLQI